jgi:hypothetical protein
VAKVAMKFRLKNFILQLGPAPTEEANFFSIERRENGVSLLRAGTFAEKFDSSLTFYVKISESISAEVGNCWFELQRRGRKRQLYDSLKKIDIVGDLQSGTLYGQVRPETVSTLLNEFWLDGQFRIIGAVNMAGASALEIASTISSTKILDIVSLPHQVSFILEMHHLRGEPFLIIAFRDCLLSSVRNAISLAAAALLAPLLEIGSGWWH